MVVTYGDGDTIQETISQDETVISSEGRAALISDTALETDTVELSEIDSEPGRLRIYHEVETDDGTGYEYTDTEFDSLNLARLAYGLWVRCGPFTQPEEGTGAVPTDIAISGNDAIAAYLRLGNGYPTPADAVARRMGVTTQTIYNYCNRVRWTPGESDE